MRKLKIAVVCGYPPNPEGESHYSSKVYNEFAGAFFKDFDLKIFAHKLGNDVSSEQNDNITIERVTGGGTLLQRTRAIYGLYKRLKEYRPDVVHCQGINTKLYGGLIGEPMALLFFILSRNNVPVMLTIHSTWMKKHLRELWAAKGFPRWLGNIATNYVSLIYRVMIRFSDRCNILIAGEASPIIEEFLQDHSIIGTHVYPETHPCGSIDTRTGEVDRIKGELGWGDAFVFLSSGFVRRDKGYDRVFAAFEVVLKKHFNCLLVIAGEPQGEEGWRFARELEDLRLTSSDPERIRLVFRYLDQFEFERYFKASSAVIIPYTRAIGASGPIHHALTYGKSVIATAVDQNRGLEKVIKLYDPSSTSSLGSAMLDVVEERSGSELFADEVALEYAAKNSWARLAESYARSYKELVGC